MSRVTAPSPPDGSRRIGTSGRSCATCRPIPGRMRAVQALDRWLDDATAAFAQAFVAANEQVIAVQERAMPEIDTVVANQLIGSVNSARMMGAEVIISGLSAEISQTLVTVGIDLGRVVSAGDLQGGIELAEAGLLGA